MNIYLVSHDLRSEEEREGLFNLLNSVGQALQVHQYAVLLATDLETQDIHDRIRDGAEYADQWVITRTDAEFTGRSHDVDKINRFLEYHGFNRLR